MLHRLSTVHRRFKAYDFIRYQTKHLHHHDTSHSTPHFPYLSSSVEGKGKILAEISRLDYELALIKIDTKRLLESDERLEKLVCNLDERLVKLSDQTDQKFDAANETSSNRFAGTMTAGFVGVYAMFWGFILLK